jgi:hypothetical protein
MVLLSFLISDLSSSVSPSGTYFVGLQEVIRRRPRNARYINNLPELLLSR